MSRKNTFVQQVVIRHLPVNAHLAAAQWSGLSVQCSIGRSGVRRDKREGDGATPAGRWLLRYLLYRPDRLCRPLTGLPVFSIQPDSGWCDDPGSTFYNRPVRLPFAASHEILWRDDHLYDLVVVTGHNDSPPIPGRGSAVFIHLRREDGGPTEGCVAFRRADLLHMLKNWNNSTCLVIPA